jgi:hypothetical protein
MLHYRAFKIDRNGRVFDSIDLSCVGDEDAKKQAEALVNGHDIELWRLDRRISVFKAKPAE